MHGTRLKLNTKTSTKIPYLLGLAHGVYGLNVMTRMPRVVHAYRAHRRLADHAIHRQTLLFVFTADDIPVSDLVP